MGFAAPIAAQASLKKFTPPEVCAPIQTQEGGGASMATVGVLAGLAGAALGAGAVTAMKLGKAESGADEEAGKD